MDAEQTGIILAGKTKKHLKIKFGSIKTDR